MVKFIAFLVLASGVAFADPVVLIERVPERPHYAPGLAVGGAGVAVLLAALAAGVAAHGAYTSLEAGCAPSGACDPQRIPDAADLIQNGHGAAVASDVLLGVGLSAVVAGTIMLIVERVKHGR
jgi:hypothetical protein